MARPEKHDEPTDERAALYTALDAFMALVAADNCNYQRDTMRNEGLFDDARKAIVAIPGTWEEHKRRNYE